MTFTQTERTTSLRAPEKLSYDKATAYRILDEAYICHVGYATGSAAPWVLPTAYGRIDDTLYFHGSTGSRAFLTGRQEGVDVCLTVTIHDGIIFSRSWFHHSANYRCVIVHGKATTVTDPQEKWDALAAIVDSLAPGRAAESREPTPKELAQTGVLALPLREVSVKIREGGPKDDPEDLELPYWAGVVPLVTAPGQPQADQGVTVPAPGGLPGS